MSKSFSARGAIVDFEMLKIKAQLAAAPAPTTVTARRTFIEEKASNSKKEVIDNSAVDALMAGAIDIESQGIDDSEQVPVTTKKA